MLRKTISRRLAGRLSPEGRRRPLQTRPSIEVCEARALLSQISMTVTARIDSRADLNGDGAVMQPRAAIVGQTSPGATVRLEVGDGRADRVVRASRNGAFQCVIPLQVGRNEIKVDALGRDGSTADTSVTATRCDALIEWNRVALDAIRVGKTNPPLAARNLAMVQLAVYDAVNSLDRLHQPYGGIEVNAAPGGSMVAAVAGAADEVLSALYPQQTATFDATLAETLRSVRGSLARTRGLAVGRQVGDAILALRAHDGSDRFVDAPPATGPGMWSPTPPTFSKPVGLNFAYVTPFAMTSPSQFRPGPPPALNSVEYAAAYNEVKLVGGTTSTVRTPDQTAFARFWADLPGHTFTPPGHWNQVAQDAAMSSRLGLPEEARLFALLDTALADAGISCWETKNFYDFWRPVTAIRAGNADGNPLTTADPTWTPLWDTPAFSSYTSGHATFSAAAATVLDAFFGPSYAFTDNGDPTQGLAPRHFVGFDQAAAEAAASRMYGGIHFRFDNEIGLAIGRQIGLYVLQQELR